MNRKRFSTLEKPRMESLGPMTIVGLLGSFSGETWKKIPELWQSFSEWDAKVDQRVSKQSYGVMWDEAPGPGFHYLAGVEFPEKCTSVPEGLHSVTLSANKYAVFTHRSHVSELFRTTCLIYQEWVPKCHFELMSAHWFERYGEDFNRDTGLGLIEIFIPLV